MNGAFDGMLFPPISHLFADFFLCISGWPEQQLLLAGDRVVYRLSYLMAALFTWGFFPFIQTTTLSVEFIHKNDDDGAAM